MSKHATLYSVLLFSLAGCVQLYKPLEPQTQARIKQFKVENIVTQDELIIRAQSPGVAAAAGGGLIPALIDSAIASKRQDEIHELSSPFYKGVDTFDVRSYIANESEKLKELCPDKIESSITTPLALNSERRLKMQSRLTPDQAFLAFSTDFTFTPDYKRLFMMVTATLWLKESDSEPAYQNRLIYESNPQGNGLLDSTSKWGADSAKAYKTAITMGFNDILRLLAIDLKCQSEANNTSKKAVQASSSSLLLPYNVAFLNSPIKIEGQVISETTDRVLLRSPAGFLYSLPIAQ